MTNEQIASAYAIAKTCGYESSLAEFRKSYTQYFDEAIKELNTSQVELAKCEAIERPF